MSLLRNRAATRLSARRRVWEGQRPSRRVGTGWGVVKGGCGWSHCRFDGARCGGSGGSGSDGELLTRRLLLKLSMLDLVTECGVLHLVDVVGGDGDGDGDGEKIGRCVTLPLVV